MSCLSYATTAWASSRRRTSLSSPTWPSQREPSRRGSSAQTYWQVRKNKGAGKKIGTLDFSRSFSIFFVFPDLPSPVLSTDDSDDDGAPPPLPPPRSESLKMQQLLQSILASQEAAAAAAATRGGEGETQTNPGVVDPMAALFPNLLRESGELRLNGNGGEERKLQSCGQFCH